MEDDRLLSLMEASKIAQRSPERLRQYIHDGRLSGELVGKTYVVRESAVRRLIEAGFQPRKPGPKPRKPAPEPRPPAS